MGTKAAPTPVPADLGDHRVRTAWYAALPQHVVGRLAHALANGVPQTLPEGRVAVALLARWLRGQATADECQAAAEAAWGAAVREWDRAAPLMGSATRDNGADDPRAPGDAAAAAASAAQTTTAKYAEAASRVDAAVAAILGWPEVRRLLEQEICRDEEPSPSAPSPTVDRPRQ